MCGPAVYATCTTLPSRTGEIIIIIIIIIVRIIINITYFMKVA